MIAIATCVVLRGLLGHDDPGRGMASRARRLIMDCDQKGEKILIPLPAVVETLTRVKTKDQREFVEELASCFVLGEMNQECAVIAGRIERVRCFGPAEDFDSPNPPLKMDALIAAIAIGYGPTHPDDNTVASRAHLPPCDYA